MIDATAAPRAGEELDLVRLQSYLGKPVIGVEQFPSGHSNLTYLIRLPGEEWVLRRPPFGSTVKTAHDMGREFRILSKLHPVYPPAPRPLLYCEDPGVLGAPFYLMERRHGLVIRRRWPEALGRSPELCRRMSEAFIDNLIALHKVDYEAAGLGDFGKPEGYIARQVEGWARRWVNAQTESLPDMDHVAAWLKSHMPAESRAAVIHNDYKFDNVMLNPDDPTRIVGVFDWEMATVADPLMDLGTALSYWMDATDQPEFQAIAFAPTLGEGFPDRTRFLERYFDSSGREMADVSYYYVYGLFKLAVILQQIFFRYTQGLTKDARFASFAITVRLLSRQAAAASAGGLQPGGW